MIETERLILRPWKSEDLEPFAAMTADPRVMEYFPATLTREESDRLAARFQALIEKSGWGMWAVSVKNVADFIGFIGLNPVSFRPEIEIGWRLAASHWGKGYAVEGAKAALQFGFETLNLNEIIAFTTVENKKSRRVMEKLGMIHTEDFDHPQLPEGHPLRHHVLYQIRKGTA